VHPAYDTFEPKGLQPFCLSTPSFPLQDINSMHSNKDLLNRYRKYFWRASLLDISQHPNHGFLWKPKQTFTPNKHIMTIGLGSIPV